MEVDPPVESGLASLVPVNIWCFLGKDGARKVKADLDVGEAGTLTLDGLKQFVCRILGSLSPNEIDVLYNGGKLKNDEDVKAAVFRPLNVIIVVKIDKTPPLVVDVGKAGTNIRSQIPQIALAVRQAFLSPKFIPTIMKMGTTDMLEKILEAAPGLKNDPIGIAMIQDPAMIYHMSDFEALKKIAVRKPWVAEGLQFLATSVHENKDKSLAHAGIFNPAHLADDFDMDDEDDELGAGPSSRITREQLSAALHSAFGGRGPLASTTGQPQQSATGSSLFDLFSQAGGPQAAVRSAAPTSYPSNAPDVARLLSSLQGAASSASASAPVQSPPALTPALTPEMVARAMSMALNSLPPEAREARFTELRDQIARIQGTSSSASSMTATPAAVVSPPSATMPSPSSPTNSRYAQQLLQMREMGVHDERLSILALNVSDGDVGTAVELILSGWAGEGADVEMPDEE